jgi:uncharacterized membrane protein YphA (DoxX/SURF4 family)
MLGGCSTGLGIILGLMLWIVNAPVLLVLLVLNWYFSVYHFLWIVTPEAVNNL